MKCQRPGVSWNKLLCWLHYNPICKMRKTVFSCWGIKLCCEPFPLREHTLPLCGLSHEEIAEPATATASKTNSLSRGKRDLCLQALASHLHVVHST